MELALPIIALGGMFVISNQKNKSCQKPDSGSNSGSNSGSGSKSRLESFANRDNPKYQLNDLLPNVNPPAINYPTIQPSELYNTSQAYQNPNVATDKYFDQNLYEQRVNSGQPVKNNMQNVYTLSGNYLDQNQFKHNNMVPFYGGKMKGYTYDTQIAETVLDNMVGSGSQNIKKIEQAPLFKPEDNVQWAFGTPNNSDFYQSRVNPGTRNHNVKPFESERVAPGLNAGYNTQGSGGYNSGMESRDDWLPKTVDELRVATNPKLEYSLENHEGPGDAQIKNLGKIGRVEKNRPDRFYIQSQDRWFTTTGAEKGETLRPIQEMGVIRRENCDTNYIGAPGAGERSAAYIPPQFEQSKRKGVVECGEVPHSRAIGKGPNEEDEELIRNHTNYGNHRSTVAQVDTMRSGFSRAVGAAIAPFLDILKPSRKEEVCNNIRVYGDVGTTIKQTYVINPADITPTTIKETTLFSKSFNINNQKGLYVDNNTPLPGQQRATTDVEYTGAPGGEATGYGNMIYDSTYRQHNNDKLAQTVPNRINHGNTNIYNPTTNLSNIREDCKADDGRWFTPSSHIALPPSKENYGAMHMPQTYYESQQCRQIEPSILEQFRTNPYTHSLTTSV